MLALFLPAAVSAANFAASLDRGSITLGESATLSLTFEGGTPGNEPPATPAVPNLQITYIGPSSQFSVINGQVSSTVTYNFTVTPRLPGDYTIPPMGAEFGGQRFTTQPLRLSVLKPGAVPPGVAGSDSEPAFLRLVIPKKQLYLGETAVVELRVYLSDKVINAAQFRLNAVPADGFNFSADKRVEGQRRHVQVGGSVYSEIPITLAMTPVKTGHLTVGPVTAELVVEVASQKRRRDALWDPFGMLGGSEQRTVSLATDAESVEVLPLPEQGVPANFNGVVGNYTMTVGAGPTNLALGDPITVRIRISGNGALDSLSLQDQPAWHDFKVYPASAPKTEAANPLGLSGSKTFEEVVVPQSADIKDLPPFSFSYFDTEKRAYQTLTGPSIPLTIQSGGAAAVPVIAAGRRSQPDSGAGSQDIVPIKQRMGELAEAGPPLLMRPWFIGLQGAPALALVCAVLRRRRVEKLAANPRLLRQRKAVQAIREGRRRLGRFAAEKSPEAFFAEMFRLLQEQLGERLDLPASAITEAVIDERLRPRGVPEPALASLHELFQTCNLARYAPVKTSRELAAIIPRIDAALHDLQELKP
jgi:hypothetical protein